MQQELGKSQMSGTNRWQVARRCLVPPLSLLGAWLRATMCVPVPFSPVSLLFGDPETAAWRFVGGPCV